MIRKPYFENSEKEIEHPLSKRIFAHIKPASAPMSVKLAPKLLPAINANVGPNLEGNVKDGLWKAFTNNIVIGWLFITPAVREDRKHVPNTAVGKLPEIFESRDANKSVQPPEARLSTIMKSPIRKGAIFQGILDKIADTPERYDTISCRNIRIAKNKGITHIGTPVRLTGRLIKKMVQASAIEPNMAPFLFLRAERGSILGALNFSGILRRKTSQSKRRHERAAEMDGKNIHLANSTNESP